MGTLTFAPRCVLRNHTHSEQFCCHVLAVLAMEENRPTAVKVLVQFQQRCRPVEFTRVPGTPDVDLLKDAVRQVFCDVSKLAIPGAVLIFKVLDAKGRMQLQHLNVFYY